MVEEEKLVKYLFYEKFYMKDVIPQVDVDTPLNVTVEIALYNIINLVSKYISRITFLGI